MHNISYEHVSDTFVSFHRQFRTLATENGVASKPFLRLVARFFVARSYAVKEFFYTRPNQNNAVTGYLSTVLKAHATSASKNPSLHRDQKTIT